MKPRLVAGVVLAGAIALIMGAALAAGGKPGASTANYPDLRAIVPAHLQVVNQQQETLRFSNGIGNTGGGRPPWALRPDPPIGTARPWAESTSTTSRPTASSST